MYLRVMEITKEMLIEQIGIYPTDTIYGIGCNALNEKLVSEIKEIKQRDANKPLSIIAPSIDWIKENCLVNVNLKKYLPGPYTIILKKKNPNFLKWVSEGDSIGIRIPDCDFTKKIQEAGIPFITTSVNLSGENPIVKVNDIPLEIIDKIGFVVNEGELNGRPSTLVIEGKEIKR